MDTKRLYTWVLALSTKSTQFFKVFKLFKLLKIGKIAITLVSMLLSVVAYAWRFNNFWVAVGFVIMLFIHEMGHVIALKIRRYEASAPVFVPFLGALVFAPSFKSSDDESFVGYAGPLLGGIAALFAFVVWVSGVWKSDTLLLVTYLATTLNLFNLIPVPPLDGGRVTRIVGGWFKWIGLSLLLAFSIVIRDASILLIWLIVLSEMEVPGRFRLWTSLVCYSLMIVLLTFGYTSQTFVMCVLDGLMGALVIVLIWVQGRRIDTQSQTKELIEQTAAGNPLPTVQSVPLWRRIMWFGLYAALAAALVYLMIAQLPHLELLLTIKK